MNNNINNKSISIFVKDDHVRIKNVKIVLQNKKKSVHNVPSEIGKERKEKKRKKERSKPISIVNTFVTVSPSTKREEEYISHSRHARDRVFFTIPVAGHLSANEILFYTLDTWIPRGDYARRTRRQWQSSSLQRIISFHTNLCADGILFLARIITEIHKFSSGQIPFHFLRKRKGEKGKIIIRKEITRE